MAVASAGFLFLESGNAYSSLYIAIYFVIPIFLFLVPMIILKRFHDHTKHLNIPKVPSIPYSNPQALKDKSLSVSYINWDEL